MTRRRLGTAATRNLAASPSLEAALATLVDTPYGHDVRQDQTLTDAQRAVVATLLWNVRVLAGWAPGPGVTMLRALVGVLEAANVEDHLRRLAGAEPPAPYRLGGLATAWPRLARTTSTDELRRVLSASPWGDPGGDTPREVGLAMRAALVDRVMATAPSAATWAIAATALVVAREVIRDGHELPARARDVASRVLGAVGSAAGTLPELVASLPPDLRWTLADVAQSGDLWRAEARWWAHVDHDGRRLARAPVAGSDVLVGVVAMMAADAWRVRAALELAARGGAPMEVFDAVA